MSDSAAITLDERKIALAAVMCPQSHDGTDGLLSDGSRCYVCIARAYARDARDAAAEGWEAGMKAARHV